MGLCSVGSREEATLSKETWGWNLLGEDVRWAMMSAYMKAAI